MGMVTMTISPADLRRSGQNFTILAAYLQAGIGTPGIKRDLDRALQSVPGDITLYVNGTPLPLPRDSALRLQWVIDGSATDPGEWLHVALDLLNVLLPPLARWRSVRFTPEMGSTLGTGHAEIGEERPMIAFSPSSGDLHHGRDVSPPVGRGTKVFFPYATVAMVLHLIGACRDEHSFDRMLEAGGAVVSVSLLPR